MTKTRNRESRRHGYFLYGIITILASIMAGGCSAQSGLMTRPQPSGGVVVNPWQSPQERKFEALETSFQEKISRAERLAPNSEEVRNLKSEYQKIKRLWQVHTEENASRVLDISELPDTFVNSVGITMKLIKPGTFMRRSKEITITKPFYMGVYEVTGQQFSRIMAGNTSTTPQNANWNSATAFCQRLSQKEGLNYKLPTEVQWEYACRAGTTTKYSFGDKWDISASRQANPWGLYDMHGNALEWCSDWYGSYANAGTSDPQGPASGSHHVARGGSRISHPMYSRSDYRNWFDPNKQWGVILGFRVVLVPE